MIIYRGASSYTELKTIVEEFEKGRRMCETACKAMGVTHTPSIYHKTENTPRLLFRPDARVENMESKVDSPADQMDELSLLANQPRSDTSAVTVGNRGKECI